MCVLYYIYAMHLRFLDVKCKLKAYIVKIAGWEQCDCTCFIVMIRAHSLKVSKSRNGKGFDCDKVWNSFILKQ